MDPLRDRVATSLISDGNSLPRSPLCPWSPHAPSGAEALEIRVTVVTLMVLTLEKWKWHVERWSGRMEVGNIGMW
jgi:hypothetical protein